MSPEPLEADSLRDNERLEKTDALHVDVIHTDSDRFGTVQSIGDADFHIGNKLENLGSEQSNCSSMGWCDHSRAEELMRLSIGQKDQCWAHFSCRGETETRGCAVDNSCSPATPAEGCKPHQSPGLHFGYWWDGREGDYGVLLEGNSCYQCLDDGQCSPGRFCDLETHLCVEESLGYNYSILYLIIPLFVCFAFIILLTQVKFICVDRRFGFQRLTTGI